MRSILIQRLIEVVDRPLPGQLDSGLVITRRRVVVETVICFGIDVSFVLDAIRLEGGFVLGPPAVDVGICLRKVKQQRGLDLGHVRNGRRGAIQKLAPADAAMNVFVKKTELFFFPLKCLL